ncbi:MAG: hypothetical protein K2L39_04485 [Muribaculaceae bacterium]|nr:hypothetical protein [Muribaculaceae bacterium]
MNGVRQASYNWLTGLSLLYTLGFTFTIEAILMMIGVKVAWFDLPLGFIVSQTLLFKYGDKKQWLLSTISSILIIIGTIFIGMNVADSSYDGNAYHQEMVTVIGNGEWNPYFDRAVPGGYMLWTIHYAKGIEILAASIMTLTGSLESGKAINLILFVSTALLCWEWIKCLRNWSVINKAIFLVLLLANPVTLIQWLNYENDFHFYCYLLLTILFGQQIVEGKNRLTSYVGLSVVILLAIATKFNAFFFEGLTVICLLVWMLALKKYVEFKRAFWITSLVAIVSAVILCSHPYITNWVNNSHPLYPLMGKGGVDIMGFNTPAEYVGHNRFFNFLQSYFVFKMYSPGTRVGGFGSLFAIIFVFSLLIVIYRSLRIKRLTVSMILVLLLLASCFVFEQSWWARYICQLWLIVPIAYYDGVESNDKLGRLSGRLIACLGCLNSGLCLILSVYSSIHFTATCNAVYETLNDNTVYVTNARPQSLRLLEEHNIDVIEVPLDKIPTEERYSLYPQSEPYMSYFIIMQITDAQGREINKLVNENSVVFIWNKGIDVYHRLRDKNI